MIEVLLNVTEAEIESIGGDLTHYRDLLNLDIHGIRFRPLQDSPARRYSELVRRAAGRACAQWQPPALRSRLMRRSRSIPTRANVRSDVIWSHIFFPISRSPITAPIIWTSQGLSPPTYYEYANAGRWGFDEAVGFFRHFGRVARFLPIFTAWCAENLSDHCPELASKVRVMPPFVADDEQLVAKPSVEDGVVEFAFIGLDSKRKGLADLLNALDLIDRDIPLRLNVVTRPSRTEAARMSADPRLRWLRSSPAVDVASILRSADVLVLPTRADTFGAVLVEAQARRCAVICASMQPLPEVAGTPATGALVDNYDHAGLARAMIDFCVDQEHLRKCQRRSRKLYEDRNSVEAFSRSVNDLLHLL